MPTPRRRSRGRVTRPTTRTGPGAMSPGPGLPPYTQAAGYAPAPQPTDPSATHAVALSRGLPSSTGSKDGRNNRSRRRGWRECTETDPARRDRSPLVTVSTKPKRGHRQTNDRRRATRDTTTTSGRTHDASLGVVPAQKTCSLRSQVFCWEGSAYRPTYPGGPPRGPQYMCHIPTWIFSPPRVLRGFRVPFPARSFIPSRLRVVGFSAGGQGRRGHSFHIGNPADSPPQSCGCTSAGMRNRAGLLGMSLRGVSFKSMWGWW